MAISITQQQTIGGATADWSGSLTFNQIDPSAGALIGAMFTTTGTLAVGGAIENLSPAPTSVNFSVWATIVASAPGLGVVGSVTPFVAETINLGGLSGVFGNAFDFGGASGTVLPEIVGSVTQNTVLVPSAGGGLPLLGNGEFDVAVSSYATSTVNGNGNLAVLLQSTVGAVVSLQTNLAPPGSPGGGYYDAGVWNMAFLDLGLYSVTVSTKPQVVDLASQTTGWTGAASFAQFDPSLGTLIGIDLNVGNTIAGTFSAENLENVPAQVTMAETASMTVTAPGGTATAAANNGHIFNLSAFDGSSDFGGTSGDWVTLIDSPPIPASWNSGYVYPYRDTPGSTTLIGPRDLAAFTGTGTIALPVSTAGTSTVTGPSNLLTEITQHTGGTVSVTYEYIPAATLTTNALPHVPPRLDHVIASAGAVKLGPGTSGAPRMSFIGGSMPGAFAAAQAGETFVIGNGSSATIGAFSLISGTKLDLTTVLAGAPLAPDLSNLSSFLRMAERADPAGGFDSALSVNGPSGTASVTLVSAHQIAVADLLNDNVLVLPAH